ncbi:MAG: hypothetical protein ACRYF7_13525 [Janthinobacterium lividum]
MKSLGFKFAIERNDIASGIEWHFPRHVRNRFFKLSPHTTTILVKDLDGKLIARTENRVADSPFRSTSTSYDHHVADVSVTVTYACGKDSEKECYGATTYTIPSVSKFILANPDAVNLKPKCQKLTDLIIDCTKYESEEHP